MSSTVYFVRLKPRPQKKRKGVPQTPSRYMIRGVRFEEARGWYRITDVAFARELKALTHNDREDGIPIFDVCTPSEAEAIKVKERRARTRVDVEDAEVQTVSPQARRARARAGAVTTADARPEVEEAEPAMVDGADGDEEIDPDDDGTGGEVEALGKLDDGPAQELDDGDDLLEQGGREPRAPKLVDAPATSPRPATRTAKKGSSKKAGSKKSEPPARTRSTARAEE